ncbi:MAG: hypothetical protein IIT34_00200, partial [Aeriscardovia sp.]|nr:hypothetical protein [Aeriscardovia sp.]
EILHIGLIWSFIGLAWATDIFWKPCLPDFCSVYCRRVVSYELPPPGCVEKEMAKGRELIFIPLSMGETVYFASSRFALKSIGAQKSRSNLRHTPTAEALRRPGRLLKGKSGRDLAGAQLPDCLSASGV